MVNLIKSEYIKGRRSFGRKSLLIFPLLVALMAISLMGGDYVQIGAYNWWYMMFLPTVIALVCINMTDPEKRMSFYNVSILPISRAKIWLAKVWTACSYLLAANMLVFGLTTTAGIIFGSQFPAWRGISAAIILTITWAWQIPLGLFLSARFNSVITFLGILITNIILSSQSIAGGSLWFIPFAIPARLMAPILRINPNGISLDPLSALNDTSVILPGLLITASLFIITLITTKKWFDVRED